MAFHAVNKTERADQKLIYGIIWGAEETDNILPVLV